MKKLLLSTALVLSLGAAGCVTSQETTSTSKAPDVCCEFTNGCAHTRTNQQCTNAGGTPKAGQCTAVTSEKPPSVSYKCQ